MSFVLESPGIEEKWYSVARIEMDDIKSNPSMKIGRVGAHIRKYDLAFPWLTHRYEALPQVQPEQRKKFLKTLQNERKNLPLKLQDATGSVDMDATAEETTAVFYVLKRKSQGNVFTVHRCPDWYEFRKAPKPAVMLSYEEANKMVSLLGFFIKWQLNMKDRSKFEEKLFKKDPEQEG